MGENQTSHLLAGIGGLIAGLLLGVTLTLGGRSEPQPAPMTTPTPAPSSYVCRIAVGVSSGHAAYRLEIPRSDTNPSAGAFALNCAPTP